MNRLPRPQLLSGGLIGRRKEFELARGRGRALNAVGEASSTGFTEKLAGAGTDGQQADDALINPGRGNSSFGMQSNPAATFTSATANGERAFNSSAV